MADVPPLRPRDVLTRASTAVGKVDLYGRRGVTMLSCDECEAMAVLLAILGIVPTVPGQAPPKTLFLHFQRIVE